MDDKRPATARLAHVEPTVRSTQVRLRLADVGFRMVDNSLSVVTSQQDLEPRVAVFDGWESDEQEQLLNFWVPRGIPAGGQG